MDAARDLAREHVEQWLREQERLVLPHWMAELRRQGGLDRSGRTTRELRHHVYLIYYDRLCQAVVSGETGELDRMLRRLVRDRVRQNYDIQQILQFPLQLKSTLWRLISQQFTLAEVMEMMDQLDPILDHSTGVLVEAYREVTDAALNERVEELEILTRRLGLAGEERERAFRQLQSLYTISRTVSSTLNIREILEAISRNLAAIPAIERCSIWLVTSSGTLQASVAKGEGETDIFGVTLALDEPSCFLTRALLTRQRQRLEGQEDVLASHLCDRMAVAIPMLCEDRPVGVVMIEGSPESRHFDVSTIGLVQAATEQAAIALENAQLYDRVTRFNQELEEKVRQRTAELEEANDELERTNRNLARVSRTMSDFINIAAHELKTPLTLIQGYTHIMHDDATVADSSFLGSVLEGIMTGSERLYDIIENMIDVSLIDSQVLQLRPAQISVRNLVCTLRDQYAQELEKRQLTLRLGDLGQLPFIEADSQRLYQVFENLLVNAIKYTPDGGTIEIDGRPLGSQAGKDWIELVFSDSGIGIDPEHQERIFDKFYQTGQVSLHSSGKTKYKGGGPGLGLAIAKGIIEAHGGRIWVESEGCDEQACPGSQFHIILPVRCEARSTELRSPFSYARPED